MPNDHCELPSANGGYSVKYLYEEPLSEFLVDVGLKEVYGL